MRNQEYKEAKLKVFERCAAGFITESQRDQLLTMLESKKGEELTPESIKNFFDQLKDKYPDLEDKIDGLQEKIDKADDGNSKDKEDSSDDDGEVSEAAIELMSMIDSIL